MGLEDFQRWKTEQNLFILHFDGAEKGNPRAVGVGGVIFTQGGQIELSFSWGLGVQKNNIAEALAFLQVFRLVQEC